MLGIKHVLVRLEVDVFESFRTSIFTRLRIYGSASCRCLGSEYRNAVGYSQNSAIVLRRVHGN